MTLFTPPADGGTPESALQHARPRADRRRIAGWALLVVGVVGSVVVGMLPAPYVIERPGPVYDTLGEVTVGDAEADEDVPLIDIPDERTYPTTGSLDLLTVNIAGSPQSPVNWVDLAVAWFDPSKAVVPMEAVYPAGVDEEQSDAESAAAMTTSQQEAIAAALTELGYDYTGTVIASQVAEKSPASKVLKAGDEILSVDGVAIEDVTALRAAIAANGVDSPLALGIRRGTSEQTVSVTPVLGREAADGTRAPIIGIVTGSRYDFPIDVKIQLENVGGPSAGQMFALGIIDKLTPGAMTGGERIAGTGTIAADGTVGAIGGIRQKMYGAVAAGADWFLAPASNCDEVVGHVPDGLTVYSVSTLDDSLAAVAAIASGDGLGELATCTAG